MCLVRVLPHLADAARDGQHGAAEAAAHRGAQRLQRQQAAVVAAADAHEAVLPAGGWVARGDDPGAASLRDRAGGEGEGP